MDMPEKTNYIHISEEIIKALGFAARAHHGQKRKDELETPYFSHPAGVGIILTKLGCREEVIIAGILHDVIEDTEFTYQDITAEFSEEIANLVLNVSIPSGMKGIQGKQKYLENLKNAPVEACMISAADMLYNRADLIAAIKNGKDILQKFNLQTYTDPNLSQARIDIIAKAIGQDHAIIKDLIYQHQVLLDLLK